MIDRFVCLRVYIKDEFVCVCVYLISMTIPDLEKTMIDCVYFVGYLNKETEAKSILIDFLLVFKCRSTVTITFSVDDQNENRNNINIMRL